MLGLSEQEKKDLLRKLGFVGKVPSNEEIQKKADLLQNRDDILPAQKEEIIAAAETLIDYNSAMEKFNSVPNKRATNLSSLEANIREITNNNPTETFASATASDQAFSSAGKITLRSEKNSGIPEDFEHNFQENLRGLNFQNRVPLVGSSVTGYIAGRNLARIMSIGGNVLVRLGSNNELTEKEMAKLGAAAVEAATTHPEETSLEFSEFSDKKLSRNIKELAKEHRFRAENMTEESSPEKIAATSDNPNIEQTHLRLFNPSPLPTKPTTGSGNVGG